jgi:predicted P-loop ATPase
MHEKEKIPIENFIDIKESKNGNVPLPTISNFMVLLDFYGYQLRYNIIKRETNVIQKGESGVYSKVDDNLNNIITLLSDYSLIQGLRINTQKVYEFVKFIAYKNKYNPIKDSLINCHRFKKPDDCQLDKFLSCLEIKGSVDFSITLIKKWLIQCIGMIHNEKGLFGADGVLVLKGKQGIGKTSILRNLSSVFGLEYFKESADFDGTKDKIIENTCYWVTELGEFARTNLKDIDNLKALITAASDEYRQPYERVSEKHPRLTSFGATINDDTFLRDTENRRFWTVEIKSIDLAGLSKINYFDFWGEIYELYLQDNQGFRLTPEERETLQDINKSYRVFTNEEQVLFDSLDWEQDIRDWEWKTTSQVMEQLSMYNLKPVNVGKALNNICGGSVGVDAVQGGVDVKKIKTTHGKRLYLVPDKVKTLNYYNPFTDGMKKGPTRGGVVNINSH